MRRVESSGQVEVWRFLEKAWWDSESPSVSYPQAFGVQEVASDPQAPLVVLSTSRLHKPSQMAGVHGDVWSRQCGRPHEFAHEFQVLALIDPVLLVCWLQMIEGVPLLLSRSMWCLAFLYLAFVLSRQLLNVHLLSDGDRLRLPVSSYLRSDELANWVYGQVTDVDRLGVLGFDLEVLAFD